MSLIGFGCACSVGDAILVAGLGQCVATGYQDAAFWERKGAHSAFYTVSIEAIKKIKLGRPCGEL